MHHDEYFLVPSVWMYGIPIMYLGTCSLGLAELKGCRLGERDPSVDLLFF